MDNLHAQIIQKIIESQEAIIGPVALEQARHVEGITIDWSNHSVTISGDNKTVVDDLVEAYKELFGQIAVEVSKDAVTSLTNKLSPDELPKSLN